MLGAAAILSEPIYDLKEKILDMLTFTAPAFQELGSSFYIHEEKTIACGCNNSESFATNETKQILCFFCGTLFYKEKLDIVDPIALSDAACVLRAYEKWHEKCFEMLDGDFSVIIYDMEKKELLAARDRSGVYPLYWYQNSHAFLVATSIKALLATGIISPTPDNEQLACYFSLGYITQEATAIQDVNRMLPGYYLKRSFDGKLKIASFWSYSSKFLKKDFIGVDFSQDLYRDITHHIDTAIQARIHKLETPPSVVTSEIGAYIVGKWLRSKLGANQVEKRQYQYIPVQAKESGDLTAHDFLESLVPIVWAQETPNANIASPREYHFSKMCYENNFTPFFDTGFSQEFHVYAMPGRSPKHVITPIMNWIFHLLYVVSKEKALFFLRKTQEAKPQVAFFEGLALLHDAEREHATPAISHLFNTNILIHQFYNLNRLPTLNASLFYLMMKTYVIDSVVESRNRFAQSFGLKSHSPFLDTTFLEFLAARNPDIWASPDILPSFPQHWLSKNGASLPTQYMISTPQTPTVWLKAKETRALYKALKSGILVESGYVSLSWLKKIAKRSPELFMQKLYATSILEIWMRLFIDLPIQKTSRDVSVYDLLSIPKSS